MKRPVLLFIVFLCASGAAYAQTVVNSAAPVVTIEKEIVYIPCDNPRYARFECKFPPKIAVTVAAEHPTKKSLKYEYVVSAGAVIGSGNSVNWHIRGLLPGTYTIDVTVTGPNNFRAEARKVLTVANCDCGYDCPDCPGIEVESIFTPPSDRKRAKFTIKGIDGLDLSKTWTVSNGRILSGQGTDSIIVEFEDNSIAPEATFALDRGYGSNLCETCPNPKAMARTQ